MDTTIFQGNVVVGGFIKAGAWSVPAGIIGDNAMDSANPISVSKYLPRQVDCHGQSSLVTVAADQKVVYIARAAGTVNTLFMATLPVACTGGATVTVNVLKNGVNVTSTPITFTNADAAYAVKNGLLSISTFAANDVFELLISTTAPSGVVGKGITVSLDFQPSSTVL